MFRNHLQEVIEHGRHHDKRERIRQTVGKERNYKTKDIPSRFRFEDESSL